MIKVFFTILLISTFSFSATVKQCGVKSVSSSRTAVLKLDGNYSSEFDFQGGNYKINYSFTGNKYSSELFFENEPVSTCKGTFVLSDGKLKKKNRIYMFVRAENPGAPEKKGDIELDVRNLSDSGFELKLTKDSEEGFSDPLWVALKKKK